jgi:hypothetical protein
MGEGVARKKRGIYFGTLFPVPAGTITERSKENQGITTVI